MGAVRASPPVRARLFPRHRRSRLSSHFDQTKAFRDFEDCLMLGKMHRDTLSRCNPSALHNFLCFRVSDAELAVFFARSFSVRYAPDVPRPPLSHSHHTTFHTKRNNGCFRRYHPLSRCVSENLGGRVASRRPGRAAAGPDWRNRAPKHTRKKPYPLRSRPGTRARGRERRHDAETNVTARRALTFCPVDAITRLSSAARPPASSAARPSRCVVASAFLPLYSTRATRVRIVRSPASSTLTVLPAHLHAQAAAVNTTTEAAVKVAINGFGRIGTSPSHHRPDARQLIEAAFSAEYLSFVAKPLERRACRGVGFFVRFFPSPARPRSKLPRGRLTTNALPLLLASARAGRFVRCWMSRGAGLPLEVVCVNQSGGAKPAAHLLKYDSILGTFDADVKVIDDATISVNGKTIKVCVRPRPPEPPLEGDGDRHRHRGHRRVPRRPGAASTSPRVPRRLSSPPPPGQRHPHLRRRRERGRVRRLRQHRVQRVLHHQLPRALR